MRYLAAALIVLALAGCNKLTESNYAQLRSGMTIEEVEAVMGNADRCEEALGFRACEWGDEQHYIHVKYMGEKVISLSKKGLR